MNINKGDQVEVTIKGKVTWVGGLNSIEVDNEHIVYRNDAVDIKVVEKPVVWSDGDVVQSSMAAFGETAPTTWSRKTGKWFASGMGRDIHRTDSIVTSWVRERTVVVLKQKEQ